MSDSEDGLGGDDAPGHVFPSHLGLQRTHMICGPEMNYHVSTTTSAMAYMSVGMDNSWDFDSWSTGFDIDIVSLNEHTLEFELKGVDPAIANALRRIMIAEVETVAIEHVFVVDNSSVMQEEVLAHRLGLVPLALDPSKLEQKEGRANEKNTVVFKMHVQCRKNADGTVSNDRVDCQHLLWLPSGSEFPSETATLFKNPQPKDWDVRPVLPDVLLCKLAPGQCIELEAHAIKGQGWDHAKWSPVGTAWYRPWPEVVILHQPPEDAAQKLVKEVPSIFYTHTSKSGQTCLKARNARKHMEHLERVRHLSGELEFKDFIQVRKRKEHFIFYIETVGQLKPERILLRSIEILRGKCENLKRTL